MSFSKFDDQVIGVMNVYMTRGQVRPLIKRVLYISVGESPCIQRLRLSLSGHCAASRAPISLNLHPFTCRWDALL